MRLVRVSGPTITPSEPITALYNGSALRLLFDVANDGTESVITATADNNQPEDFEHGLIKFRVDASHAPYAVDNGELIQTIVDGSVATCYVQVAMPAHSNTYVTISPDESSGVDEGSVPSLALLGPAFPNPAGTRATVAFSLGAPGRVTVSVYDISGRLVATLLDGPAPEGPKQCHLGPGGRGWRRVGHLRIQGRVARQERLGQDGGHAVDAAGNQYESGISGAVGTSRGPCPRTGPPGGTRVRCLRRLGAATPSGRRSDPLRSSRQPVRPPRGALAERTPSSSSRRSGAARGIALQSPRRVRRLP